MKLLLCASVAAVGLLVGASVSEACDCLVYSNPTSAQRTAEVKGQLALADMVFVGEVVFTHWKGTPNTIVRTRHVVFAQSVGPPDQGRSSILDLLVWGAQMNVDLGGYPSDVRGEAEAVIARSKAYHSKRPQPTDSDGLSRMVHQARVTYERRLVAMAGTPDADLVAVGYVTDLAPCYEWEGYSDCPAREAAFAAEYQAGHPAGPFSQFLPLLEAHRWLCAAEGFDYEKNADAATTARARYRAALNVASASRARLVRIGATELQARGTCINVSRQ